MSITTKPFKSGFWVTTQCKLSDGKTVRFGATGKDKPEAYSKLRDKVIERTQSAWSDHESLKKVLGDVRTIYERTVYANIGKNKTPFEVAFLERVAQYKRNPETKKMIVTLESHSSGGERVSILLVPGWRSWSNRNSVEIGIVSNWEKAKVIEERLNLLLKRRGMLLDPKNPYGLKKEKKS